MANGNEPRTQPAEAEAAVEETENEQQQTGPAETDPEQKAEDRVSGDEDPAEAGKREKPDQPGRDAEAEMEALRVERDQYRDALIRERADFENYKKRNASLSAASFDNGTQAAVEAVLPVVDNFERALAAECADETYVNGMKMIMRQFENALEGLGVQRIATDGAFDPVYHHAVLQVEEEGLGSGEIAETLQNGYLLKDKVIRPAMVKVNK